MKTFALHKKSDFIGAAVSGLCLVHCLATPLLFAAHAGIFHGLQTHPKWWGAIDLFFLIISLLAVFWSTKNSSKKWIRHALWINWIGLAIIVLNEKIGVLPLPELLIYPPAIGLIVLHLYNRKYCQCTTAGCCVD